MTTQTTPPTFYDLVKNFGQTDLIRLTYALWCWADSAAKKRHTKAAPILGQLYKTAKAVRDEQPNPVDTPAEDQLGTLAFSWMYRLHNTLWSLKEDTPEEVHAALVEVTGNLIRQG